MKQMWENGILLFTCWREKQKIQLFFIWKKKIQALLGPYIGYCVHVCTPVGEFSTHFKIHPTYSVSEGHQFHYYHLDTMALEQFHPRDMEIRVGSSATLLVLILNQIRASIWPDSVNLSISINQWGPWLTT